LDGAVIQVYVDKIVNGEATVYAGTQRTNLTALIENGEPLPPGAPAELPLSDGAALIFRQSQPSQKASLRFSYRVVGTEYPWWQKPFLS
jgi:hypothetical protein